MTTRSLVVAPQWIGDAVMSQPLLAALAAHPTLRTLHRPANLEDLFLKLTGRQIRE